MTFKPTSEVNGTSLRGIIDITYQELVDVLGNPHRGPYDNGDKVSCEWMIQFEDKTVATIYDWKTSGVTPMYAYNWHIGGYPSGNACNNIQELFASHTVKIYGY